MPRDCHSKSLETKWCSSLLYSGCQMPSVDRAEQFLPVRGSIRFYATWLHFLSKDHCASRHIDLFGWINSFAGRFHTIVVIMSV